MQPATPKRRDAETVASATGSRRSPSRTPGSRSATEGSCYRALGRAAGGGRGFRSAPRPPGLTPGLPWAELLAVLLAALLVAGAVGTGRAQRVVQDPPAATAGRTELGAALAHAREALADALAGSDPAYPDQPLWRRAIAAADAAASLAPDSVPARTLQAEVYTRANWPGPAWKLWQETVAQGIRLDSEQRALAARVGNRVAYAAYERGEVENALETYRAVSSLAPRDLESVVWQGRLLLELRRPEAAVDAWQRVVELDPGDARAAWFLQLAQDQVRWGVGAANAFREGVRLYEANEPGAGRAFAEATELNPAYAEAWAWRGRLAFEAGDYAAARRFYREASELAPRNDTYRYFRDEAGRRLGN